MLRRFIMMLPLALVLPAHGEPLTLRAAVAEALANNPASAMLDARAKAASQLPSQLASLPDPRIGIGIDNWPLDSLRYGSSEMTMLRIAYRQEIPALAKRNALRSGAEHDALAAQHDHQRQQLQLAREVRESWWSLYANERALEILKESQQLLRQSASLAQGRYKVGLSEQQEVLLTQLASSKLLSREFELNAQRRIERARLNALLNRAPDSLLTLPTTAPAELPVVYDQPRLEALAHEAQPILRGQQQRTEAARARLDFARLDRRPDYMVEAAYGQRPRMADMASLMVSVALPIHAQHKQDRAVDQRNSELLAEQFAQQDLQQQIQRQLSEALAEYQEAREQHRLLGSGIIPQARQAVDTLLAAYQVGSANLTSLLEAEVMLNDYRTQQIQLFARAQQALARLQAATGSENIHE